MQDEDTPELTEEEQKQVEKLNEMSASDTDSYGYPTPPSKDSQFKFFRELLQSKDSSKIGNLKDIELGNVHTSVRGLQNVASYAEAEGLDTVGKYLRAEAEIILATSDSRKGFLAQLFVTQIKREQKPRPVEQKKGIFSFGKKTEESEY